MGPYHHATSPANEQTTVHTALAAVSGALAQSLTACRAVAGSPAAVQNLTQEHIAESGLAAAMAALQLCDATAARVELEVDEVIEQLQGITGLRMLTAYVGRQAAPQLVHQLALLSLSISRFNDETQAFFYLQQTALNAVATLMQAAAAVVSLNADALARAATIPGLADQNQRLAGILPPLADSSATLADRRQQLSLLCEALTVLDADLPNLAFLPCPGSDEQQAILDRIDRQLELLRGLAQPVGATRRSLQKIRQHCDNLLPA